MSTVLAVACFALLVAALAFWRLILREREQGQLVEAFLVLSARMDRLSKFVADNQLWADPDEAEGVRRVPRDG